MSDDSRSDLPMPLDDSLPIALPFNGPQHDPAPPADDYRDWITLASQRHVRSLAVGPNGEVWLATAGGVLRWSADMEHFTRYASEHGLPGNSILAVAVDGYGQVWAAHESGQLSYLDVSTWRPYVVAEGLGDLSASCLAIDELNRLWAAGSGGLYVIDSPQNPQPQPVGPTGSGILAPPLALALAGGDVAWLCNARGVYRYQGAVAQPPREIAGVLALARQGGNLWLGTTSGLLRVDLAADKLAGAGRWPRGEVTALATTETGVWAACAGQIGFATEIDWTPIPVSPLTSRVTSLAPAGAGEVWIATHDGLAHGGPDGIRWQQTQMPPEVISIPEQQPVPFCNLTQALAVQRVDGHSVLWIGTARGLFRFDLADRTWRPYTWPGMQDVRALATGVADAELWAASWEGGLRRLKGRIVSADAPKGLPRPVLSLSAGPPPGMWACVAIGAELGGLLQEAWPDGIYSGEGANWSVAVRASALYQAGMPARAWVQALGQANDGILWIGTSAGLFAYDCAAQTAAPLDPVIGAESVRALLVISTPDALLCVGTSQGLYIGPPGALARVAPLAGRAITALAWDGAAEILWIGTQTGLVQLCPAVGWTIEREWNTRNSGLAADYVLALALSPGEQNETHVWVGTPCGVSGYCHRRG